MPSHTPSTQCLRLPQGGGQRHAGVITETKQTAWPFVQPQTDSDLLEFWTISSNLSNIHEVLSTVTLHCIQNKINLFTMPYQSSFKLARSYGDLVWAQQMLLFVALF